MELEKIISFKELDPVIVLHQVIVRSGGVLKFPYELYGWPIEEYLDGLVNIIAARLSV